MQVIFRARVNLWAEIPNGSRTALVIQASEWALKHPILKHEVTIQLSDWYAERKSIGLMLPDDLVERIDNVCDEHMTRTDWLHWAVVLYQRSVPNWAASIPLRTRNGVSKAEPKTAKGKTAKGKTAKAAPKAPKPAPKAAPKPAPKAALKPAAKAAKPAKVAPKAPKAAPKPAAKAEPKPAAKAAKPAPKPAPKPASTIDFDDDFDSWSS